MRIQDNISAMNINRFLGINKKMICKNTEKLSSGYRINRAGDDAAGLSISEKMRNQIRGLNQAVKNIEDGISLIQTAEGALNETHSILARMRELAVQAANDIYDTEDRMAIQAEVDELVKEVDDIANKAQFNEGIYPLLGNMVSSVGSISYKIADNLNLTQFNYTFVLSAGGNNNPLILDGITYNPGDTFSTSIVRIDYEMNGEKFMYYVGAGFSEKKNEQISESEREWASAIYTTNRQTSSNNIGTMKLSDFGIDENNDLYCNINYRGYREICYLQAYYDPLTKNRVSGRGNKGSRYNIKVQSAVLPTFSTKGSSSLWIQSGANVGEGVNLSLVNATSAAIGIKDISVMSNEQAGNAIRDVDGAVKKVSEYRSMFGAQQSRLERTMAANMYYSENLQEAESKLRDTDMAEEIAAYFKQNVLLQAGRAILAQANKSPQEVLSLLQ